MIAEPDPILHHPTPADATWSTTNLAESIPGVPTPLGWSIWYPAGELAVRRTFRSIGALSRREARVPAEMEDSVIGIFYGHAAVRVDLLCAWVERVPGVDGAAMAQQTFSAVPEGYESKARRRYYPRVLARSLVPFVKARRLILEDARDVADRYAEAMSALPEASEAEALGWLVDGAALWTESLYRQALLSLGTIQPAMERLTRLAERAGVPGQELMAGYGSHEENKAIADTWACSRGRLDIDTFVARHGYQGWRSGEISSTVWREDRATVLRLIERYQSKGDDADPALAEQERIEKRRGLEAQFLAGLPVRRRPQGRLALRMATRYVPLRGVGKGSFLRGVDIARAAARRLGRHLVDAGQLDHPDDAFYFTLDEHRIGLASDTRAVAAERRAARRSFEAVAIPQSFRGVPPTMQPDSGTDAGVIDGTGASPGIAEGTARVVTEREDAHVEEGEILVAHDTDPSWASLMFLSAGLVADVGGIMSHTAVVARELGIPCIVNTKHASRSLRTGDRIRVDGTAGRVEVLSRS